MLVEGMARHGGCTAVPRGDAPRVAPASIVTLGLDPRVHAEDQPAPWRGGERTVILGSSPRMTVLVEGMTRHGGCTAVPRGDIPRVAPASIVTLGLDPRVHAEDQPVPWRGGERMGMDPRVKPEDDVPCGGGLSARLSQLSDCPSANSARCAGRRWQVQDSRPGPTGRHGCGRFPARASGAQAPAPSRRRGGPATPHPAPWR